MTLKGTNGIAEQDRTILPEQLRKLESAIKNTRSYNDYWETLNNFVENNKNAKIQNNNGVIKFKEYIIKPESEIDLEYDKHILKGLKNKGISIAPEFVASATNREGFSIAILKCPGAANSELIDYQKGFHLLTDEAKQQVYNDMKTLLKLGIVNKSILNGNALKINPETKKVICTDWQDLCPVDDYDKGIFESPRINVMNQIFNKLFNNK